MNIVVICNGLGNQMSQYAFYLKKKSMQPSTRFIFDKKSWSDHNGYELNAVFGINYRDTFMNKVLFIIFRILGIKKLPFISKPLIKLLGIMGISLIMEPHNYDYDESLTMPTRGLVFYYGGWHSERYFISNKEEVLESFNFLINENDKEVLNTLREINMTNSVSLHVRRGDYMSETNYKTFGAVCTKEYFEKAILEMESKIINPHFFIFSNDLKWVKDNLKFKNMTIIDFNKGADSWKDMFLMSNCKHNINSNSSFSWWGAWLNNHDGKTVVVPRFFINNLITKDIYPQSWLQLEQY